jgi:hypothetical protein
VALGTGEHHDQGGIYDADGRQSVTVGGGSLASNQSVNLAQVNGTATDTNSGVKSAGTQRVVLATDQPALSSSQASAVVTQTSGGASVTTASTALLASNATRKGSLFVNTGTAGVTLKLGATATAKTGVWLAPGGGSWDGLVGTVLWTGAVDAISDSGTNVVTVVEV